MLADRRLFRQALRVLGATAGSLTLCLCAVDRLDPSAAGEPWAVGLSRAAWLGAAALVVATAALPAALRAFLLRDGQAVALQAAGVGPSRAVVRPTVLGALVAALALQGLGELAQALPRGPASRPAPLEVVPWASPEGARWRLGPRSLRWEEQGQRWDHVREREGLSVRVGNVGLTATSRESWVFTALRGAQVGALGVGLAAALAARRGGLRATVWGTVAGLALLVVAVVAGANLAAAGRLRGAFGALAGVGVAAVASAAAVARTASRRGPRGW
ncbi:MAG: hypothetical protein HY909_29220 [Deltaproteobacteria bacterium]|nr:hypothetical protein [Deltaproteobacteria bacterium]